MIAELFGQINSEALLESQTAFYATGLPRLLRCQITLADAVTEINVGYDDLLRLSTNLTTFWPNKDGQDFFPHALVTTKPLTIGLANQFRMMTADSRIRITICSTPQEALNALGLGQWKFKDAYRQAVPFVF